MIDYRVLAAAMALCCVMGPPVAAQAPDPAAASGSAWQSSALSEVKDQIRAHYVFPEMRAPLLAAIDALEQGGTLAPLSGTAFGDRVTRVMQDVAHDKHLALVFDPNWAASFAKQQDDPAAGDFDREAIRDNFGIVSLERLTGNIRYMKIDGFGWVDDVTGETYDAAARFLKAGSAIIIDIRGNSGGDHSAVRYLVSHFMKPDTPLYEFQSTREATWRSYALDQLPAGRINGVPLYVLIDGRTVSAGEDLAYQVQQYQLGKLVGTRTAGAANNNEYFAVAGRFRLSLSVGRPVHPVSQTNWEGRGIQPDIAVPTGEARDRAILAATEQLLKNAAASPIERAEYRWAQEDAEARLAPASYSGAQLRAYAGQYGDYLVKLSGSDLWLEARNRDPLRMVPLKEKGQFGLAGRSYLRVRFAEGRLEVMPLGAPEPLVVPRTSPGQRTN